MTRICCVIPYFGKFSNYFKLWVKSCEKNDNIDFLLISNNAKPVYLPSNFIYMEETFEKLKEKIQAIFDFKINLNSPYKLCDYKPAYGEIFYSELKGYDFWGYIDCDLILGNSKKYLSNELLEKYDKLYTHGHFTLFRNTDIINQIYRNLDIKKVYTSDYCFHLDEWGGY